MNVSGDWSIFQSNGFVVQVHLTQDGGLIFGSANTGSTSGEVRRGSSVNGGTFLLVIDWHNGTMGEYNGNVGLNGRLTGISFDLSHPESQASWFSDRTF
jgi:hypothetical protein